MIQWAKRFDNCHDMHDLGQDFCGYSWRRLDQSGALGPLCLVQHALTFLFAFTVEISIINRGISYSLDKEICH